METNNRRLIVFNQVTLDGYFSGEDGDLSWAHHSPGDVEWNTFVSGNMSGEGTLLFGRKTYEMMAGFWPTPMAEQFDPVMARQMNEFKKVVFSKTLNNVSWENTKLIKGDLITEISKLKQERGDDLVILGSGSIVNQLVQVGLIDEIQIVLFPIAIGKGRTMFNDVAKPINFKTKSCRTFKNGNIFICYEKE
jgi:dihydrofolate reductase